MEPRFSNERFVPRALSARSPQHDARRRARSAAATLLALVATSSCQSYEPRPLDPVAHRREWSARTLRGESLEDFLRRLDERSGSGADRFDPTDGLNLDEGELVALVYNPDLRLARLRADVAAASAEHAGLWEDPRLDLSILRITEGVPDPWVVTPGLTVTVPLSGRLEAEVLVADAEVGSARAAVREAEWATRRRVRDSWIEWSAARMRADELERLAAAMRDLASTAERLAESGELLRTEATLFHVEELRRRNRSLASAGEADARELELRALLGLTRDAAVRLEPSLRAEEAALGEPGVDAAHGIEDRNPRLARLRAEYAVAEETLRREIREQYPDPTLGPQVEWDEGQFRVGLLGGFPLPLWNANRRAINEARVRRELARAAVEAGREQLVGRWYAATVRATSLAERRNELERVLVPLVDRQLEDAMELTRLGEGSTAVLLESLSAAYRTKLELIDARVAEALARSEATFLVGPRVPRPHAGATETNE